MRIIVDGTWSLASGSTREEEAQRYCPNLAGTTALSRLGDMNVLVIERLKRVRQLLRSRRMSGLRQRLPVSSTTPVNAFLPSVCVLQPQPLHPPLYPIRDQSKSLLFLGQPTSNLVSGPSLCLSTLRITPNGPKPVSDDSPRNDFQESKI